MFFKKNCGRNSMIYLKTFAWLICLLAFEKDKVCSLCSTSKLLSTFELVNCAMLTVDLRTIVCFSSGCLSVWQMAPNILNRRSTVSCLALTVAAFLSQQSFVPAGVTARQHTDQWWPPLAMQCLPSSSTWCKVCRATGKFGQSPQP